MIRKKIYLNTGIQQSGKISLNVLIIAAVFALGLVYLFQVSCLIKQSYNIRSAQKEMDSLVEENKKIQAEISMSQSLPKLEEAIKDFGMAKADNIQHLDKAGGKVAIFNP
jgi:cell division protein FtsB